MTNEELLKITTTVSGIEVKNLRWLPLDNIITGLVKCPIFGKSNINDGFVSGMWKRNGIPTNRIKGMDELKLNL